MALKSLKQWMKNLNREAQNVVFDDTYDVICNLKRISIHRIPAKVLKSSQESYIPQLISIGPFHNSKEQLNWMEEHKERAMLYTLKRSNLDLEVFVKAVEDILDHVLASYEALDQHWKRNQDEFLKMMLIDANFLIELFRKSMSTGNYPPGDPIFGDSYYSFLPFVMTDLLLVENQVPILLLEKLAAAQREDVKFIQRVMSMLLFGHELTEGERVMDGCVHLLHFYLRSLFLNPKTTASGTRPPILSIGSASDLNKNGITFKKSSTSDLCDVSFKKGILCLPFIVVDEISEAVCLNILAFERLHLGAGSNMASYIHLMAKLFQKAEDVTILNREGLLGNELSIDSMDVVKFYDRLSKCAVYSPEGDIYNGVFNQLFEHLDSPWPMFLQYSVIREFIKLNWGIFSVAAFIAAFGILLTFIQTVYKVIPFYK